MESKTPEELALYAIKDTLALIDRYRKELPAVADNGCVNHVYNNLTEYLNLKR